MPDEVLVTVVIPTHKRLHMLFEAIDSARAQSVTAIEIVVTIDGDDPETAERVGAAEDPRIRVVWDGVQRGEAGNTVRGIQAGTAPFFAVLHDDDVWESNLLERLLPAIQSEPEAAVAFGDHWVIDVDGQIDEASSAAGSLRYGRTGLAAGVHRPFYRQALVTQTIPAVMTSVYRRAAVDFTDMPELPANFDYWLAWIAVRGARPVVFVPERLSRYRVHGGSGTSRAKRAWAEASVILNEHLLLQPDLRELHPDFRRRLAIGYRKLARYKREAGEPGALALAVRSVRVAPSIRSAATVALLSLPAAVRERVSAQTRTP